MKNLKKQGYWELNQYSTLKHFKNNRANMHVKIQYCIEFNNAEYWSDTGIDLDVRSGVFWIQTEKQALKDWSEFIKTRSLGGAELRDELFILKVGA